ncbi:hypothetical protein [Bacillus sp. FJAT-49736]|uniref:hypothetical protein n=1 Tax=Bacillus sp. FJAT-49736 TaxID=2833582 RepID=UPI001BC8F98B|nr:hypothetical protein [Bacillus sp. FJAT-49736]MBS4172898.1 hypothetical protein [Bacillus sp. FJAT-49736]
MFDPTAYENMKVVIEGAAYDLDIDGNIKVVDRKDIIDLARMNRWFEITYRSVSSSKVMATFTLEANLNQLASELLHQVNGNQAGADVHITFSWDENGKNYKERIKKHWGTDHVYEERKIDSSSHGVREEVIIGFSRAITEDMIDDLIEMFHYSVETLEQLN